MTAVARACQAPSASSGPPLSTTRGLTPRVKHAAAARPLRSVVCHGPDRAVTKRQNDGRRYPGSAVRLADLPPLLRDEPGLTRALGEPDARLAVGEVARPIAIAALADLSGRTPLVVACPTGTMAAQLADDLAQFLPAGQVAVFPAWETLPFERVSPSVETMGQRLELLWRLARPRSPPGGRRHRRAGAAAAARARGHVDRADRRAPRRHRRPRRAGRPARRRSATAARSWSSTAASSPAAAPSSTCSRPRATRRSASTCGATRSTG